MKTENGKSKLENRKSANLRLVSNGVACTCSSRDEVTKKPLGKGVSEHALRMPLDAHDPVGVAGPLDAFDGSVRRMRRNAQIFARLCDGLVVRAVYLRPGVPRNCREPAAGFKGGGVDRVLFGFRRDVLFSMWRPGSGFGAKILDECSPKVNVEKLATVANGENRLFLGERVTEDGSIGLLTREVGGRGKAAIDRTVFARLHIGRASGKDEGVQTGEKVSQLISGREREQDGLSASLADGIFVVLDFGAIVLGFFLRGAPRNAHTGTAGSARLGTSGGHGTPNRSIRARGRQPGEKWLEEM